MGGRGRGRRKPRDIEKSADFEVLRPEKDSSNTKDYGTATTPTSSAATDAQKTIKLFSPAASPKLFPNIGQRNRPVNQNHINPFRCPLELLYPSMDPELRAIKPPMEGEFPRLASATPSEHSSKNGDFNLLELIERRNAKIEKYLADVQTEKKSEKEKTDWEKLIEKRLLEPKQKLPKKIESVSGSSESEFEEDDQGSVASGSFYLCGPGKRRDDAWVQNMVKNETKRISKEIDNLKTIPIYGAFSHETFEKCRKTKWHLLQLERTERILRGELFHERPVGWVCVNEDGSTDMESMKSLFEGVFGPMDKQNSNYSGYLTGFILSRLEMEIEMMASEECLIRWLLEKNLFNSEETTAMANVVSKMRKELESNLWCLFEANVDLNPYTTALHMDYFVVPRLTNSIENYTLQHGETELHTEFKIDKNSQCLVEGYSPALFDVSLECTDSILGEEPLAALGLDDDELPKELKGRSLRFEQKWIDNLTRLKKVIMEFKEGVAPALFLKIFKDRYKEETNEVEKIYGMLAPKTLLLIPDIFYKQELEGKENNITILFPSELQGGICTPKEILLRHWKRLKFLLKHERLIPLDKIDAAYQKYYQCPCSPLLYWGFKNVENFVLESLFILPEELDFATITEESEEVLFVKEVMKATTNKVMSKSKDKVVTTLNLDKQSAPANLNNSATVTDAAPNTTTEEQKQKKERDKKMENSNRNVDWKAYILKNNWYPLQTPLPKNCVFRIVNRPRNSE